MKYLSGLAALLLSASAFAQESPKATLKLENGNTIKGNLVEKRGDGSVVMAMPNGEEYVYEEKEIRKLKMLSDKAIKDKRGYIGISAGPSFPFWDFHNDRRGAATVGMNISVINFGYRFGKHFGISANWYGGANPIRINGFSTESMWSYGGMHFGGLVSFPLSDHFELDLKPMIGYCATMISSQGHYTDPYASFSIAFNTMLRYHLGGRVSATADVNVFHTRSGFGGPSFQNIQTISTNLGFAIRL